MTRYIGDLAGDPADRGDHQRLQGRALQPGLRTAADSWRCRHRAWRPPWSPPSTGNGGCVVGDALVVPPVVIQMPPTSIWGQLLPALVGVFGAVLGVAVTSWATRSRERNHYAWERRANLYLELLGDVGVADDVVDGKMEPVKLTFEDPARFEELA